MTIQFLAQKDGYAPGSRVSTLPAVKEAAYVALGVAQYVPQSLPPPVVAHSLLFASAVAVNLTGTTSETVLATVTVPAGAMGLNGGIELRSVWTVTNSANNKSLRARLGGIGGTSFLSTGITTNAAFSDLRRIRNRNSASSQLGSQNSGSFAFGTSASALVTSAIDTSIAQDIVFTGQLALGSETITLESYEVWLLP